MNIDELKEKIKETNKLVSEHAKEALDKAFENIFNKYPEVVGFKWHQYVPSFNDGDPCEFYLNEPEYILYSKDFADKVPAEELENKTVFVFSVGDDDDVDTGDDGEDNAIIEESGLNPEQIKGIAFTSKYTGDMNAAKKEIMGLFTGDVEDIFEEAYGSGHTMVATKKGLSMEEYYDY
jgi:hypothetical protein